MIIDIHIHTNRYSPCSNLSPYELLIEAQKKRLDGIAITEHDIIWPQEELDQLKRYIHQENFLILKGQEIRARTENSFGGDILVFGFHEHLKRSYPPKELIDIIHQNGGIAIAAHPFRPGLGLGEDIYNLDIDAIEVLNSNNVNDEEKNAQKACDLMKIAAVGGSDAHSTDIVGYYATYFEDDIKNESDLIKAIKDRKCRPIMPQLG